MMNRREEDRLKLLSTEKKEKNEIELSVEIEPPELETAVNKAYHKNKNRIAVPGFRKGKAPRKMIERMYGPEIFLNDALDELLPAVLSFVKDETEFNTVGYPKISNIEMKDKNVSAEITLIAALYPEVKIGKYKGLKAPKAKVEVPNSEIEKEVESARARNARIEKADRPAKDGDIAVIDFEGFVDNVAFEGGKGENYELTLGSGQFIPGFEEKVAGMTVGEKKDLDLVFPEQYKAELAGKPVVFKVKLNEVKEKILPDLDDEFAKDVSEFDTLKDYKADIKKKLLEERQKDVDETFENILIEQVADTLEADVPETMIDEQVETSMEGLTRQISAYGMQPAQYMQMLGVTPEQFKERMRENSEKQVRASLALQKIAELEGIEISEKEIEEEYKSAAEQYKMKADEIKEKVPAKDIVRDLKLRNAAKVIIDNAIAEEFKEQAKDTADKKPAAKKPAAKKPAAKKAAADNKKAKEE